MAKTKGTKKEVEVKEVKAPEVKEVKKEEPKTVQIDAAAWKEMQENITRLTAAADLNRLSKYDQEQANKDELIKKVKISHWKGVPILATILTDNEVFYDSRGIYHENQNVEITTEDGEKISERYVDYLRFVTKISGEIMKESKDKDGNTVLSVRLPEGKLIDIDNKFVN